MGDPKVAAAIAAGRVPDDVSADYLNETRDQPAIAAIIFVTVLTAVVVLARTASRAWLLKHYGLDDVLALFGLITLIPFVILSIILINEGSGRHYAYIQYVLTLPEVDQTEILDFAAHLIYTTSLLLCRFSGLAFYHRICSRNRGFRIAIRVTAAVIGAAYLPQMFLIIFHCLPVTGLWPYAWQPHVDDFKCLSWGIVYSVNSATSLFCDMLLFGIPIAMLRMLDMPRKRKIQLGCILLPGTSVIAISISRLVLVIKGQWDPDESWSYNPMLAVETSEIGATLIALSVPGLKPMFDKYILRKAEAGNAAGSGGSGGFRGTARSGGTGGSGMRTRVQHSLRTGHSALASDDNLRSTTMVDGTEYELEGGPRGDDEWKGSQDGIMVRVDFKMKEEQGSL